MMGFSWLLSHDYMDLIEAISKMPNVLISAFGLNRNPQNIFIYSCGYDPSPSLTSNHFSIFEMASNRLKNITFLKEKQNVRCR